MGGKWALGVALAAGLVVIVSGASAQPRCATQWNPLTKQYETRCSDGSTSTEKYNALGRQWERTTQGPAQRRQRCYTAYNALTRQWETVCR